MLNVAQPGLGDKLIKREKDQKLVMLGYNQALLDTGCIPEGMTRDQVQKIVSELREKLGK